ncbi:MAG TPA: hypothetical protein VMK32_11240, partial [Burkholderiaceae bacterium]|nr:hypothetical protein [Burkholderiaceae bacterium]
MQLARPASPAATTIHRWLATLLLTGGALTGFCGTAQERPRASSAPPERTPPQWVQAIQRAAMRVSYSGT